MESGLGRLRYEVKTLVAQHPVLALPVARRRGHGVLVNADTDILIEGYPRSANSFSVAAFELAQGRPVRIAHHVHAPAHVIAAARAGIPAIVLIRDPGDSVPEFVIAKPHVTIAQALRGYVRFYEPLMRHWDRFVVGRFQDVTTDFGAVIRRVNCRFGTDFREFQHTEENVRICFAAMERYWEGRIGRGPQLERVVGRPSAPRDRIKSELRRAYEAPHLARLRDRAERLCEAFGRDDPGGGSPAWARGR